MIALQDRLTNYDGVVKVIASNARLSSLDGLRLERSDKVFPGDVCLFEVLSLGSSYNEIENAQGRSEKLYVGDCFLAPLGNRESGHYICGHVPNEGVVVTPETEFNILSNGGIVGFLDLAPEYLGPTARVRLLGRLASMDGSMNTITMGAVRETPAIHSPLVLVAASGTNTGKTTFMSSLVHELALRTRHVAAAKIAGTGCLEDMLEYRDAGAFTVLDFPDTGLPSTYMEWDIVGPHLWALLDQVTTDADITVLEAGGDIIWANVPEILQTRGFAEYLRRIVFIPGDPTAALGARTLFDQWCGDTEVTWVVPPFLNPNTFQLRMRSLDLADVCYDSRSHDDIAALAESLVGSL